MRKLNKLDTNIISEILKTDEQDFKEKYYTGIHDFNEAFFEELSNTAFEKFESNPTRLNAFLYLFIGTTTAEMDLNTDKAIEHFYEIIEHLRDFEGDKYDLKKLISELIIEEKIDVSSLNGAIAFEKLK